MTAPEQEPIKLTHRAENARLRHILSECVAAVGGIAEPNCSIEFFSLVPEEIRRVRRKDTAALAEALEAYFEAKDNYMTEQDGFYVQADASLRAALAKWKDGHL